MADFEPLLDDNELQQIEQNQRQQQPRYNMMQAVQDAFFGELKENEKYPDAWYKILYMSYWQEYFDATTLEMMSKCVQALLIFKGDFITEVAEKQPDLWYPIWMAFTLVFIFFFGGYLQGYINNTEEQINYARMAMYSGIFIADLVVLPLFVWFIAWCVDAEAVQYHVIFSLIGYSFTPVIPFAICMVPISLLGELGIIINGVLYGVCSLWSTMFITYQMFKYLKRTVPSMKAYLAFSGSMIVIHILCMIMCGLFIFNVIVSDL